MVTRNADSTQGDGGSNSPPPPPPPGPADQLRSRAGNTVFKSGPLLLSSKGIGWTSWKKRWFILTRTSLVFFRSDPSVIPQKGSEVNLTLGGIDLNNSGSVVVREDKKLLTVLFPDGRDGRAFTLKAETSEDLYEWKTALENALAQAPSAALVMGQNGIFRNDAADSVDCALEEWKDRRPVKSLVVGRPILLALEDIDGTPSFLEKALRFLEQYGVKVEGILRQAADVDDVERRVQEYEQGKNEFSPEEDAHVIADCVKHVLREFPSSPVPASCCNALLEAYRADRGVRVNSMRAAITETFPEPNCRLLQRILRMMQTVASHKSENRMSSSAVAACMAPLLLRPLLDGDCELENDFNMGGDGSVQLLQAAAAANHAQAIVITLLEEYDNIFGDVPLQDGSYSPELYSDSEESVSENDEPSDDDEIIEDDGCNDSSHGLDADTGDDTECESSGTFSESSGNGGDSTYDDKTPICTLTSTSTLMHTHDKMVSECSDSDYEFPAVGEDSEANQKPSSGPQTSLFSHHDSVQSSENFQSQDDTSSAAHASESREYLGDVPISTSPVIKPTGYNQSSSISKSTNKQNGPVASAKRPTVWGRTSARKDLSMESIDYASEDEVVIQRLEVTKIDLQTRIAKEEKENVILQASLERRKQALHERRLALEKDVSRLQEQLQRERDLREALEAGLSISLGHLSFAATIDNKTKAELEGIALAEAEVINLKQKVADLHVQLNQQREQNYGSVSDSCSQCQQTPNHLGTLKDQQKDVEATKPAYPLERTKRSENAYLAGADSVKVRTQEPPSLSNKQPPQKQHLDSASHSSMKSIGVSAISSAVVPVVAEHTASSNTKKSGAKGEDTYSAGAYCEIVRTQESPSSLNKKPPQKPQMDLTSSSGTKSVGLPASSAVEPVVVGSTALPNSKKSSAKSEGTLSTASALTKLTTRLNFLKERRMQISNELQNLDIGRGSEGQSLGPPPRTNSR